MLTEPWRFVGGAALLEAGISAEEADLLVFLRLFFILRTITS